MTITTGDIAKAIGATVDGDPTIIITHASEPGQATEESLALAMSPKYAESLSDGRARAALVWPGADRKALGLDAAIPVARGRVAMAELTRLFDPGQQFPAGIHPQSVIDPTAVLGDNVSVGAMTVIAAGARIGAGTVIGPLCYIGAGAQIGEDSLLREQVSIAARVQIGDRFIAQPGARIGADGFSFVTPEKSGVEAARDTFGAESAGDRPDQSYLRIHSLGAVIIGTDVEVGGNTVIDSGTIRPTRIGDGTKIDNLVQIGHNCEIGRNCLICGQSGLAGSVKVGNNVVMGGRSAAADNIFIGDGVISTGGSKMTANVPAGRVVMGYPATKMDTQVAMYKALRRLPRMMADFAEMQKAVFKSRAKD
ncbi:MAG: UDP-3-O-(3-hydroxymyristoyl)glucosamine N-acyltransferase [Marinibacterium sp.]